MKIIGKFSGFVFAGILIIIAGFTGLALIFFVMVSRHAPQFSVSQVQPTESTSPPTNTTAIEDPTNPPLLSNYEFSTTQIPFPDNWPENLRYPLPLVLVNVYGDSQIGWFAQLIYKGPARKAEEIVVTFFTNSDWTIVRRTVVDENNYGFFIKKNENEGVVVIGSDPASSDIVKIAITVYQ